MECKWVMNNIDNILDGWKSSALEPAVASHIAKCQKCASLVQKMKRDQELLWQFEKLSAPSILLPRVLRGIHEKKPRITLARFLIPRLSSVAAVLIILVVTTNAYLLPLISSRQETEIRPAIERSKTILDASEPAVATFSDVTSDNQKAENTYLPWAITSGAAVVIMVFWGIITVRDYQKRA
ncbi:MAG: hypothetical protein Q8N36_03465 [bacterium]|nr:hypothetical protein [bacterium]